MLCYVFPGCFQEWLKAQKLEEAEVRARATKVGKYISEKIMDINKKNKKQGGLLTDTGDMWVVHDELS